MSLKFNSLFNIFEIPISKMNFTVGMHVCVCVLLCASLEIRLVTVENNALMFNFNIFKW